MCIIKYFKCIHNFHNYSISRTTYFLRFFWGFRLCSLSFIFYWLQTWTTPLLGRLEIAQRKQVCWLHNYYIVRFFHKLNSSPVKLEKWLLKSVWKQYSHLRKKDTWLKIIKLFYANKVCIPNISIISGLLYGGNSLHIKYPSFVLTVWFIIN